MGLKLSQHLLGVLGAFKRHALHAAELGFVHPESGKKLHFESPLPADYAAVLDAIRREP